MPSAGKHSENCSTLRILNISNYRGIQDMNRQISLGLAMLAGIAIGAVAVQALHAQARPKAYSVTEIEVLDTAALNAYLPLVGPAIKAAGGRNFNTAGGKAIAFTGESPKRVAIIEWD